MKINALYKVSSRLETIINLSDRNERKLPSFRTNVTVVVVCRVLIGLACTIPSARLLATQIDLRLEASAQQFNMLMQVILPGENAFASLAKNLSKSEE